VLPSLTYCKTEASGSQRPVKPWCLVPVCTHGHGGGDDSSGDTRLARGLPFGRMLLIRPPPRMPEGVVRRENEVRARITRCQGSGQPRTRRPLTLQRAPRRQSLPKELFLGSFPWRRRVSPRWLGKRTVASERSAVRKRGGTPDWMPDGNVGDRRMLYPRAPWVSWPRRDEVSPHTSRDETDVKHPPPVQSYHSKTTRESRSRQNSLKTPGI